MAMSKNSLDLVEKRNDLVQLCNEIQEILAERRYRIENDVASSIEEANELFKSNPTMESKASLSMVLEDIDSQKKLALDWIKEIDDYLKIDQLELHAAEHDYLEKIKAAVARYEVIKESDSSTELPTYTVRFTITALSLPSYETTSPKHQSDASSTVAHSDIEQQNEESENDDTRSATDQSSVFTKEKTSWKSFSITASYDVDLLASDGSNIFYTSYSTNRPDLIAYCDLRNRQKPDLCRQWPQSQIVDMVWWGKIDSFVCVTHDTVYSVNINNDNFKIFTKVRGDWSYARVATNSSTLYLWIDESSNSNFSGINVYDDDFKRVRTVDFADGCKRPFVKGSTSFCMTDKRIASICERRVNGTDRFQVNFNGFNMMNYRTYYIARTFDATMIRTDGKQQFFATAGGDRLYMISGNGYIDYLKLIDDGKALTFVNSECVIVCFGTRTLQIFYKVQNE